MGTVTQIRPHASSRETALFAVGHFRRIEALVFAALIRAADEGGQVELTIEELCDRTGFGRCAVLQATRAVVASGAVERQVTRGGRVGTTFQLAWLRIEELAAQVRNEERREQHSVECSEAAVRSTWVDSYVEVRSESRRYGFSPTGAKLPKSRLVNGNPSVDTWRELVAWTLATAEDLAVAVELVARTTCAIFFGRKSPELVQARHPLSFVLTELRSRGLERDVLVRLAQRDVVAVPIETAASLAGSLDGSHELLAAIGGR